MKTFLSTIFGLFFVAAQAAPITVTTEQNLGSLQYRNFVKNPGAEKNITAGITNSSGILTRSTTTPIEGVAEFSIDATATTQNIDWATNTFDQGLKNSQCEARWVIEGDASLYTANVLINSVVVSTSTLANYANPQIVSISYPCGDLSTATTLRIASTGNGAAILVDSVYVGRATNAASIAQATVYGTANAYTAASCNWSTASTSFAAYSADTDCATPTVTGGLSAPATKIPAFKMLAAPPGKYKVTATFQVQNSSGNASFALSDGTTTVGRMQTESAGVLRTVTLVGVFDYTTAADRQIDVYGRSGGNNAEVTANSAFMDLSFTVERFPTQSQVVAADQVNTDWATYSLTIGATTTPPTPHGGATSLAKWRRNGPNMEIMYYFAQASAGSAGSGTYLFPIPSGYTIDTSKVTATTATIGTTGHPVGAGQASNTTSSVATTAGPATVFVYNTTNLFLTHTFATAGQLNPIGSSEIAIGGVAYIAFFASVPITGWGPTQTYYIPGSVTSNSSGTLRIEAARILNSGTPTISSQSGTWISSITDNFTGDMSLNFVSNIFSAAPSCVCIPSTGGAAAECYEYNTTPTSASVFRLQTRDSANTAGDYDLSVICMGAR